MNKITPLLLTLSIALAACSQEAAPPAEPVVDAEMAPASAPAAPPPAPVEPAKGKYLTLAEGAVDLCKHPEGLMATDVSWDATSAGVNEIELHLQNPGEERKLWAATIANGTERTGEWLRNGTQVFLIDRSNGATLDSLTVGERPCNTQ